MSAAEIGVIVERIALNSELQWSRGMSAAEIIRASGSRGG